jgi:pyrroloquinoline quinone biosynthesis protein D
MRSTLPLLSILNMPTIADNAKPRLANKARLKWDAVREKHLLLFPEGLLILNETAQEVLALCDGQRDVGQIVNLLAEKYHNDAIGQDVKGILERLAEKNLVKVDQ